MAELVSLCSLDDILERDNQKLSGGQKQRMLLALAIVPNPQARRNFWDLIRGIKAKGTTVVLPTHRAGWGLETKTRGLRRSGCVK